MKKRIAALMLALTMAFGLAACSGKTEETAGAPEDTEKTEDKEEAAGEEAAETPETSTIKWAQGLSGNVFVTIALKEGYFEEVGLTVEEIPLDDGQLEGVVNKQVDIASNSGTNRPLQMIAAGDDMAVIGGFMLEGCMPIITKEETEWKGIEDFVGKKVADTATRYPTCAKLLAAGHDPVKDVDWVDISNDADKIPAVLSGEVDYAVLGTGRMYMAENTEGIKIVGYCDDITPEYSCCRMVARKTWVEENPTTVKLLNQALLRAQCYFEANREACIDIMAEELDTNREYVEAYMGKEEHYELNVDTVRSVVLDTWNYQKAVGLIEEDVDDSVIESAVYEDLYKAALDACVEKYHDDDPEFWDAQLALYEKYK